MCARVGALLESQIMQLVRENALLVFTNVVSVREHVVDIVVYVTVDCVVWYSIHPVRLAGSAWRSIRSVSTRINQ